MTKGSILNSLSKSSKFLIDNGDGKFSTITQDNLVITKTFSELTTLANASRLTVGALYKISDSFVSGGTTLIVMADTASSLTFKYDIIQTTECMDGCTTTVNAYTDTLFLSASLSVVGCTIILPSSTTIKNGKMLKIISSQSITSLTIDGGSSNISGTAIEAIDSDTPINFIFNNSRWYKC